MIKILALNLILASTCVSADESLVHFATGTGSGPYPAIMTSERTLPNHVIYRPMNLEDIENRSLPIILWGNGGCTDDGASAFNHLIELASHGYLAIAPGKILSGPTVPPNFKLSAEHYMKTDDQDMLDGLAWAVSQNEDKKSKYFGKLMPSAIGVSGHSCGGILSLKIASANPQIKAVVIHNSGIFPNKPERPMLITDKNWLKTIQVPILYIVGNDTDVGKPVALDDFERIDGVPVFLGSLNVGHEGTFSEPNGGDAATAARLWFDWQLKGDMNAGTNFLGEDCGLCRNPQWTIQRKNFDPDF